MVKRKVSEETVEIAREPVADLKKAKVMHLEESGKSKETFQVLASSHIKILEDLLAPHTLDDFFKNKWEKEPLHIERKNTGYYESLFSFEKLKGILKDGNIQFEDDVNVCRYIDNEKELLNEPGVITPEQAEQLLNEKKATLQFNQPQRFSGELWNIMEKMETYFGNLVGANVYITPANAQGLAPHCDDVEIFALQLEGCKKWQIYKPMIELSRDYTQDLPQDVIGEPIMEVELKVGDLLYLPRGYIHQAKTVGNEISTHVTLSTYQTNTVGDFMKHATTQAIEYAMEESVSFRRGLPINHQSFLGTAKDLQKYIEFAESDGIVDAEKAAENGKEDKESENGTDKSKEHKNENEANKYSFFTSNQNEASVLQFKELIKKQFSMLVDHIDVNTASDSMCNDFIASRLPPYGYRLTKDENVTLPSLENEIKLKHKDHLRLVFYSDEDDLDERPDFESMMQYDSEEEDDESESEGEETVETPSKRRKSKGTVDQTQNSATTGENCEQANIEDDDDENDGDAEFKNAGPCLKILYSTCNSRANHMITEFKLPPQAVKFPLHFANAVKRLFGESEFVAIKDLPNLNDEEKQTLATALASQDLIDVKGT